MANSCINELEISDIVKFSRSNPSEASKFCFENNLTGRVVDRKNEYCIIDFGLGYYIYALPKYLSLVARSADIPESNEDD